MKETKQLLEREMKRRDFFKSITGSLAISPLLLRDIINKNTFSKNPEKQTEKTDVLIKVLGTAQDGGLPHFGCYCKNCNRARKESSFSRLISSLALIDLKEKKSFILDVSPDIRPQLDLIYNRLEKENKSSKFLPQGIILTHAHIGHYPGLMFFGYEAANSTDIPVYCSKSMADFLTNNGPWSQLVNYKNIALQTLIFDKKVALTPNISITPFLVPHRAEYSDTIGLLIAGKKKKLLYIPDIQRWKEWKRSIVKEVRKVNIALLDGTFYSSEELPGRDLSKIGHPFITSSMDLLENEVKKRMIKVFFTHLNHSNLALDPEGKQRQEMEKRGFNLASEGMEFFL